MFRQSHPQSPLSLWSAPRTRTLAGSDFLSMHRVFIFNCQPIRFQHKQLEVHESQTFSSDLVRVCVLGGNQKKSWLSGQN